jgi:hypothetical protein
LDWFVVGGRPLAGGCPAATHFLLLRQKKVSKEKATRWSGSLRFATGNLRCSPKMGSSSNSPSAQTIARPDPFSAVLLGPARRVGKQMRMRGGEDARSATSPEPDPESAPAFIPHPSVCAEERRSRRIRTGDCLSEASSSPAPAGPSTVGCPSQRKRRGVADSRVAFLLGTFLWRRKEKCLARRGETRLAGEPSSWSSQRFSQRHCSRRRSQLQLYQPRQRRRRIDAAHLNGRHQLRADSRPFRLTKDAAGIGRIQLHTAHSRRLA